MRTYKPTGRPPGRPPLPSDQRREALSAMVLPEVAAWLRAEAARLGVSPGRIIDTIAGRRAKAQRAKAQRGQK